MIIHEKNYYRVKKSTKYNDGMRRYYKIEAKREYMWLTGSGIGSILLYRILLFFNLIPDNRYSNTIIMILSCAIIMMAALLYTVKTNRISDVYIEKLTKKLPNYIGDSMEYYYFASFGEGVGNKEDEKWLKSAMKKGYIAHGTTLRKIVEKHLKHAPYRKSKLTCLKQIIAPNIDNMVFLLTTSPLTVMEMMESDSLTEIDGNERIITLLDVEQMLAKSQ